MEKKIGLTRLQAFDLYHELSFVLKITENEFINFLYKKGYIRKSPVEEAEEMYDRIYFKGELMTGELIDKLHEAIQYQKEIISGLENDN